MTSTIADPELDPTATYAVAPSRARMLTQRVVCGPQPEHHVSVTPMTGAPIASLPLSTRADVTLAVESARAAQRAWARTSFDHRARVMLAFHDLVLQRQVELLDLVQLESGKARGHAFEELGDCANVARHYARRAAAYLRPQRHQGAIPLLTQSVEHHRPRGVVGIVSPWNYPLSLPITDAIPALMAGNAVVLRPDLQAALSALAGHELLLEAGLPEAVFQVVLGDGATIGAAVVDTADCVCFTGSTATGRRVGTAAAGRLVPFSLELGGKNSLYVAADADLAKAVDGAVRASFSSAGQMCVSTERIIVHDSVAEQFVPRFVAAVGALRLSTALEFGHDMGSLVSRAQLDKWIAHVDDARSKGATVLAGGAARPDIGPFVVEPTVLEGVTAAMACRDEETFGPLVALYRVSTDDEAVQLVNDTDYGLNAAVFTRDTGRGRALAARMDTGTVSINDAYGAAWGSVGSPMGGMKASGMGRRHGAEGILKYTESQNVTVQHGLPVAPPPGVTDAAYVRALSLVLRALKTVGLG